MGTDQQQRTGTKASILFIDDDRDFLQACRLALEPLGYRVTTAEGGLESLQAVRALGRPDLVFLDVDMPGMDGLKAIKLLHDFVLYASVPIVMCSANAHRSMVATALAKGARDYLTKPVELQDLLECIERNLGSPPSG